MYIVSSYSTNSSFHPEQKSFQTIPFMFFFVFEIKGQLCEVNFYLKVELKEFGGTNLFLDEFSGFPFFYKSQTNYIF